MKYITMVLGCCVLVGCAQRIGDFTIISTKNYEASQKYKSIGRFTAEDNAFYFIVPWGTPNIKTAIDHALEAGHGVYMTNAVLESTTSLFTFGYRITGDVFGVATVGDLNNPNLELFTLEIRNGRKFLVNEDCEVSVD